MKLFPVLLASAAFAIAAPALAQQQVDTVDAAVPTQLPRTAVPHHYAITVTPHADKLTFDGKVAIELQVVTPTNAITLSAADLDFSKAALAGSGTSPLAAKITTDADAQSATFTFAKQLTPGSYTFTIEYSGKINTQANGLFALDYKTNDGKDARSLFTQFEAADARRFIPSWDEPDYKATFDLTAIVPAGQMAVSNMPAASTKTLGNGLKSVTFQRTPTMSSYLLFFAAGDFDRVTKPVAGKEVGIVMSRGNAGKAGTALDAEAQILPFYNQYFGVPYPLPKLDNVAGPGQSQFFGAMENWGAIFTFEYVLLDDPAITTEAGRQSIFEVEAHEMAHQWFGDLVTMAWWDDLWLNEGFASWMATKTVEHFHPEWSPEIDRVAARESAMSLDALTSTHPVVQEVRTVEQANQAFDAIAYSKGESVISMLEDFAGSNVWQTGIQRYIKAHSYRNTRTSDLWAAQEAAGAKGLTAIATDFTMQPGIPLISVGPVQCASGTTVATLSQSQFSADRKDETAAKPQLWHVPVKATAGGAIGQVITGGSATQLTVPGCGPLLVNAGQRGYYRTLYAPAQARALAAALPNLAAVDQYGLMADQMALSSAGYQSMGVGLDFLDAVPAQANAKVAQRTVNRWGELYDLLDSDPAAQQAIAARVVGKFGPRLQQLGFAPKPGESSLDALLRPTLISALGKYRDPQVVAEANRLFAAWGTNPDAIPGSLKSTWLGVTARNADAATWDALHAKAKATTGTVERTTLYELLGRAQDEALASRALELALTDEPGKTVSAGMITAVAAGHPKLAVDFVLSHLDQVNKLIDISGRSSFMQRLAASSHDASLIPVLEGYAKANLAESDRKPIERAIDRIRFQSSQLARIQAETNAWLQAHPQ